MCHVQKRDFKENTYSGKGIFDFVAPAINFIKDNATTIKDVGMAASSVGLAGKNIIDAVKAKEKLGKAREEKNQAVLKTLEIMDVIKKQKMDQYKKEEDKTPPKDTPVKQDVELERFLQQVKSGKGLKKF